MRVTAYLAALFEVLENSPFFESREINIDERPPDAAYIKGTITFMDGSILNFKEFIFFKQSGNTISKYGYHYLGKEGNMIFRYDNALDPAARSLPTWPEHKLTPCGLEPVHRPSFAELIDAISSAISHLE